MDPKMDILRVQFIKCFDRTNLIKYLRDENYTVEADILKPRDIDGLRFLELTELDLVQWKLTPKQKKLILSCRDKILNESSPQATTRINPSHLGHLRKNASSRVARDTSTGVTSKMRQDDTQGMYVDMTQKANQSKNSPSNTNKSEKFLKKGGNTLSRQSPSMETEQPNRSVPLRSIRSSRNMFVNERPLSKPNLVSNSVVTGQVHAMRPKLKPLPAPKPPTSLMRSKQNDYWPKKLPADIKHVKTRTVPSVNAESRNKLNKPEENARPLPNTPMHLENSVVTNEVKQLLVDFNEMGIFDKNAELHQSSIINQENDDNSVNSEIAQPHQPVHATPLSNPAMHLENSVVTNGVKQILVDFNEISIFNENNELHQRSIINQENDDNSANYEVVQPHQTMESKSRRPLPNLPMSLENSFNEVRHPQQTLLPTEVNFNEMNVFDKNIKSHQKAFTVQQNDGHFINSEVVQPHQTIKSKSRRPLPDLPMPLENSFDEVKRCQQTSTTKVNFNEMNVFDKNIESHKKSVTVQKNDDYCVNSEVIQLHQTMKSKLRRPLPNLPLDSSTQSKPNIPSDKMIKVKTNYDHETDELYETPDRIEENKGSKSCSMGMEDDEYLNPDPAPFESPMNTPRLMLPPLPARPAKVCTTEEQEHANRAPLNCGQEEITALSKCPPFPLEPKPKGFGEHSPENIYEADPLIDHPVVSKGYDNHKLKKDFPPRAGPIWNTSNDFALPRPPAFRNKFEPQQVNIVKKLIEDDEEEPIINDEHYFNPNDCPYYRNTDRKGARQLLRRIPYLKDGAFLIRASEKYYLVITMYYQGTFYDIGMYRSSDGTFYCKTSNENQIMTFRTLETLVEHYKMNPLTIKPNGTNLNIYLSEQLPVDIF